eukprot:306101-Rhodomonas_salina.1
MACVVGELSFFLGIAQLYLRKTCTLPSSTSERPQDQISNPRRSGLGEGQPATQSGTDGICVGLFPRWRLAEHVCPHELRQRREDASAVT